MQVRDKIVVVTGGANGIGRALCEAFHRAGAAKVVVADLDLPARRAVAASIDGAAFKCDVGQEKDILHVIEETERQFGPIALFCSNAGIGGGFDPLSENAGGTSDEPWARSWAIHVMAHVYAARHLIPRMKARGGGYFLNTISAAGLVVAGRKPRLFDHQACGGGICGESRDLAQGRRHQGFDPVSAGRRHQHAALDPERPAIRRRRPLARAGGKGCACGHRAGNIFDPAASASAGYMRKKTENYDRWISGMAKIQAKMRESYGK